ncbi:MAG: C-type lectin domain-containing protein [Myxococcales bacterium]
MQPPRLRTQRATLAACLLALAGCRIGGANAIAPEESEADDDDAISMSESPALGASRDASDDQAMSDDASTPPDDEDGGVDAGSDACASDSGFCGELPAGCVSARFEQHAYVFCPSVETWGAARASCLDLGLDLAIIESAAENEFVAQHIQATSWIGAHDQTTEGSFEWVTAGAGQDGAAVTFTSWAPAVPDNCGGLFGQQDCVRISSDGRWDDSDCNGGCLEGTFAFACESF